MFKPKIELKSAININRKSGEIREYLFNKKGRFLKSTNPSQVYIRGIKKAYATLNFKGIKKQKRTRKIHNRSSKL